MAYGVGGRLGMVGPDKNVLELQKGCRWVTGTLGGKSTSRELELELWANEKELFIRP